MMNDEIKNVLDKHPKWLNNEDGGRITMMNDEVGRQRKIKNVLDKHLKWLTTQT